MPKMSESDIHAQLPSTKGWDRLGDMLVRTWQFPSSRRALEFVNQVAAVAERAGHYPDIIFSFRSVRVELSTHSEGGLTSRDFDLAFEINALPTDR
jgi:4a-hydroxytetrahydrobiopterin dehydratase